MNDYQHLPPSFQEVLSKYREHLLSMSAAELARMASRVRGALKDVSRVAVTAADDGDYYRQMADDRHAAAEMAESINVALRSDRDRRIAAALAIDFGTNGVAYLESVGRALVAGVTNEGRYVESVVASVVTHVAQAFRISCGAHGHRKPKQ
jgi:hypothetical protein